MPPRSLKSCELYFAIPRGLEIEKVIFNNPATIVIWTDGTKTIVKKSKGDRYDKEKGLAFCYLKKIYGKDYYKIIKHLTEEAGK